MPPARQPNDDRRRQIVDAALRVIAEQGLGRFTTAAIAAEVGLTDGALFRHFDTKEAIVLAAMDRVEEVIFAGFPPEDPDPIARVGALVRHRVAVVREHPVIARILLTDSLRHAAGPAGAEKVAGWKSRTMAFLRACLEEAAASGALRPDVPPAHGALIVQGTILAVALGVPGAGADDAPWTTLENLLRAS